MLIASYGNQNKIAMRMISVNIDDIINLWDDTKHNDISNTQLHVKLQQVIAWLEINAKI